MDDILFFGYRPFSFSLFWAFYDFKSFSLSQFLCDFRICDNSFSSFSFFFFLSFQQQANFARDFVTFSRKIQVPALFCDKALLCLCFTPQKVQRENFLMEGQVASLRHRNCISLAIFFCLGALFP